jgi:hypothetical protein
LPTGTYKLQVDAFLNPELMHGWYRNASPNYFGTAASGASGIAVSHNVTAHIIRLPKGATITGVVTITGGSPCALCTVDGTRSTDGYGAYANTNATGAYKLQGLDSGSYKVYASPPYSTTSSNKVIFGGYYKKGVSGNYTATESAATPVSVSP